MPMSMGMKQIIRAEHTCERTSNYGMLEHFLHVSNARKNVIAWIPFFLVDFVELSLRDLREIPSRNQFSKSGIHL